MDVTLWKVLNMYFLIAHKLPKYACKAPKIAKQVAHPVGAFAPRVSEALKTGADIIDDLVGQGYTKAQARKMMKTYSPSELKKMCKGGSIVTGNAIVGKALPRRRLRQKMNDYY